MEKDKQTRCSREEALSDRDTVRLRPVVEQRGENVGPEPMLKKPGRSRALEKCQEHQNKGGLGHPWMATAVVSHFSSTGCCITTQKGKEGIGNRADEILLKKQASTMSPARSVPWLWSGLHCSLVE
jgi:hypothetical protein